MVTVNTSRKAYTCITQSKDIFLTFDGVQIHYWYPCTVGLFKSKEIEIYGMTECDPEVECSCGKVRHYL